LIALAIAAAALSLFLRVSGEEHTVLNDTGSYTEAITGTWERVNPIFSTQNETDADLVQLVFSGLVRTGPDGSVLPDLADLPQVSDDGRSYTFKLKPNLAWHDGAPVTSRDVGFTIGLVTAPDFKGDALLAESWAGVEVETPDAATIVIRLKQSSSPFLARTATLGILPEHLLRGLSGAAVREAPFNANPVGTGPYKVQSLDTKEAVLVANSRYHLGAPGIGVIRLRFVSDLPSAIRALSAGEVGGVFLRDTPSAEQRAELARIRDVKTEEFQRAGYLVLYLNNDQVAFFADERVRRAIALTIDRRALVEGPMARAATASGSAVPPGTWAYAREHDILTTDLAQAKKLLEEAGWKPSPSTGVLTKGGSEFRFTIRTDNDPVRAAVAGEIARQLDAVGIRATVATTTFSVLQRDFLKDRRFDAAVAGWDQGPDPDPYFGWHSSQTGSAGLNFANFGDVVMDQLIAKARTVHDLDVRRDQYAQIQEKWQELAPSVVLAYPHYLYLHAESLQGLTPGVLASPAQRFFDVQRWRN
jgi:peptide/nickel transport system substrate-binding protein